MAIPKFFHNSGSLSKFQAGDVLLLSEEETRHASMARRLESGSEMCLLDGNGGVAHGHFVELTKRVGRVQLDEIIQNELPKNVIRVASAIPKGDRQKVMLDMLCQCGVAEFIPLNCEFSSASISTKQLEKWHKIVIEACKQSGNPFLMNIRQPIDMNQLLATDIWQNSTVYRAEQVPTPEDRSNDDRSRDKLAVIGPEGGFSQLEMQQMDSTGAQLIHLGEHILRTETAAIAVVAALGCR